MKALFMILIYLVMGQWVLGQEEEIFIIKNQPPRFPGCEDLPKDERKECADKKLHDFLSKNIQYPEDLKVGGRVVAYFWVEKDGRVKEVKIIKSLCNTCEAEVIRVLKMMPPWIPCCGSRGRPVRVKYKISILFNPV